MNWETMNRQSRITLAELVRSDLPLEPGVYAVYRDGNRMYVGKAKELRQRVWSNHSGRGVSMTGSAFRRNVAEHLGISTANAIKKGNYKPTIEDANKIRDWIDACEITWITCKSEQAALDLEDALKLEYKPPLTLR